MKGLVSLRGSCSLIKLITGVQVISAAGPELSSGGGRVAVQQGHKVALPPSPLPLHQHLCGLKVAHLKAQESGAVKADFHRFTPGDVRDTSAETLTHQHRLLAKTSHQTEHLEIRMTQ